MNLMLLLLGLGLASLSAVPAAVVKDGGLEEELVQLILLLGLDGSQDRVKRALGDRGVT